MSKKTEETPLEILRTKDIPEIWRHLGEDSIRIGIISGAIKCEVIPTGCISIDVATGVGGIPRGRITEIFGPESSGKTTLAMTVIAQAQKFGGIAAMIDVEHALDSAYTAALGVNLEELLFSQPDTAEQALTICEKLIDSHKVDVIVIDSVAALTPKKVLEGEFGDQNIALVARLMSEGLSKLKGKLRKSRTSLIFINQMREKIGMIMPGMSNETTPGGRALKFYASMRIDIRRTGSIQEGQGEKVGNESKIRIVKNKVAPPFKEARFQIIFGKGISKSGNLIDVGIEHGIISKGNGGWFSYNNEKMGQGKLAAMKWLENCPDIMNKIEQELRSKLLTKPTLKEEIAPKEEPNAK